MDGTRMYDLNLKGAIGLVIGNEGEGVSRLVKEKCDMTAAIPKGLCFFLPEACSAVYICLEMQSSAKV